MTSSATRPAVRAGPLSSILRRTDFAERVDEAWVDDGQPNFRRELVSQRVGEARYAHLLAVTLHDPLESRFDLVEGGDVNGDGSCLRSVRGARIGDWCHRVLISIDSEERPASRDQPMASPPPRCHYPPTIAP
jgi:hypothetical protein